MRIHIQLLLCLPFLMAGCTSVGNMKANVAPVRQTTFELVDARDEASKLTRREPVGDSLVRHLIGDDRISPSVPRLLEASLYQTWGDRLQDRKFELTRADVRVYEMTGSNMPLEQKLTHTPPGNPVGATIAALFLSDFVEKRVTQKRIEVELEGRFEDRVVRASEYGSYRFGSPTSETMALLMKAVQKMADTLIEEAEAPSRDEGGQ